VVENPYLIRRLFGDEYLDAVYAEEEQHLPKNHVKHKKNQMEQQLFQNQPAWNAARS